MDINRKIATVIASCETKEQMASALTYCLLAHKASHISAFWLSYWMGVIAGIKTEKNR